MNLQQLSVMALWGACTLYAIAMVGYSIRLSRVAELKGSVAADQKTSADQKATADQKASVPVGAATRGAKAESTAPAGPSTSSTAPAKADVRAAKALGIARAATLVGAVLHAVGITARGFEAGHVPWSTMYEYTISGSFVAVVVFLIVQRKRDITFLGTGVTALATIALGLGLSVLYEEATGLQPALQSFWLVIHVSIATIATGILAVSFVVSVMQLMRDYRASEPKVVTNRFFKFFHDPGVRAIKGKRFRFLEAVPTPKKLEALAFRLNAVGFVLWTFTVIAGAIWAEHAWGRYWGWDPKEIWSFVIWVIYAAYLHARTTQGWAGRRSAYLAIFGFAAIIMNFTVVNLVFQGLHSYAKA